MHQSLNKNKKPNLIISTNNHLSGITLSLKLNYNFMHPTKL
jgi:hypothetical protein